VLGVEVVGLGAVLVVGGAVVGVVGLAGVVVRAGVVVCAAVVVVRTGVVVRAALVEVRCVVVVCTAPVVDVLDVDPGEVGLAGAVSGAVVGLSVTPGADVASVLGPAEVEPTDLVPGF
jgi:hypothetical protein